MLQRAVLRVCAIMTLLPYILAGVLLVSSSWNYASQPDTTPTLVFTYPSHQLVKNQLLPLFTQIYNDLGYRIEFVEAEGVRAVSLLRAGVIDGDILRVGEVVAGLADQAILLQMDEIRVVLHCRLTLPCHQSLLQSTEVAIHIPIQDATLKQITKAITAHTYHLGDWDKALEMFALGRIDYLLWVEGKLLHTVSVPNSQKVITELGPYKLYHVIHRKHAALAPLVEARLGDIRNQS